jgi:hypothetical protein
METRNAKPVIRMQQPPDHLLAKMEEYFAQINQKMDDNTASLNAKMDQLRNDLKEDIKSDLVPRIEQNTSDIHMTNNRIDELQNTVSKLQNDLERQSRSTELIVRGVPMATNEKCQQVYQTIAKAIGYAPGTIPIADAFRLGRRPSVLPDSKVPSILIRFVNKLEKIAFHQKYFAKKDLNLTDLGFDGATSRVYISESLTTNNQKLFGAAMMMKKDGKLASVSTYHGAISVKTSQYGNPTRIKSTADLERLS